MKIYLHHLEYLAPDPPEALSFLTRLDSSLQKKAFQNLRTPRIAL